MVGRNRIFSPLCLIKAVDNKRKNAINHECVTVYNKELTAVFISFYQALLIPEPGRKPGARVTNSARLFTPGEEDSIADSKVVVIVGWVVISLISKIQRITGV